MEEELAVSNSVSDDDAGQASSEILEQGDDAMDAEQQGKLFPSDEYIMLMSQITNLRTSSHGIYALGQCLRTACGMLRWGSPSSRMRQADLDCVRRLFRDDMFLSVDKLLSYPHSSMLPHQDQEEVLLETLQLLVATAAHAISYRACLAPGDTTAELDSDLVPVAQCMLNLFNMNKKLMLQLADEEVPASSKLFEYADNVPDAWAQRQFSSHADNDDPAAVEEDEEQLEPAVERNRWLVHLVNLFGYLRGFENILQLLQDPDQVGFALLNMMTAVLAQVVDVATDAAHGKFNEIVGPVMQHVSQLVQSGSERLSDHGSDRTYSIFQCLANTNLPRIIAHGPDPQAMLLQLAQVQCAFVCKMLESSSFNKLLSGVRECNRMLRNAADSGSRQCGPTLEMLVGWMAEEGIVQRILRTNLHQRQYMQEVQGIMVTLTTNQSLAPEHLDMLWAVTEKEDTYEAVKQHMFDLLAEIASRFSPNQLDMLFAKLQAARQRSTQDTQRLLGLLQHLAASDKEVHMCEKIGDMVWDLTMGDGVHPDVVGGGALANVVKAYKSHLEVGDGLDYVVEMINKCAKQLLEGADGQVPLLRSIRELLRLLPEEQALKLKGRKLPTMQRAVEDLDQQHSLSAVLVKRLCSSVDQARAALSAAREAAAAAAVPANPATQQQPGEEALQQAAMESLRQGAWSYSEVLREHLLTLRYLSLHSNSYFDGRLAERLWDTLMVDPPCREDALPATQAFFKAGFQGAPNSTNSTELFEPSTQTALLESHMVRQDAAKLSYMAARLFVDIFQQVNLESKALGLPQAKAKGTFVQAQRLADIKGLDFIWRVYLSNPDDRIAGTMRNQLLWLYHCSSLQVKSASYKRALIERIVAAMHEAAPALRGPEPAAIEAAGRAVSRCLTLALEAIGFKEMATMPPVPAHRLAWRGTPWALDVSRDGASRVRLASHSNEYVGLLRQRMARQIGCSMQNVRMFCSGHELSNDARTLELPLWDSKNRSIGTITNRAVVTAVVSPEPNAYSLAPAEFRSVYEQVSMSWMLAQAEGAYPLLLQLIESPGSSFSTELTSMALELLSLMPTYPALTQRLAAALDGPDKQQQLAAALDAGSSSMEEDAAAANAAAADSAAAAADAASAPHQTLYALQALCSLLFPTFDESLFLRELPDAEATAEAPDAEASPAADDAPAEEKAAAQAAFAAAQQQQQHRELQQQEFLQSRGLEVVLGAARKAACGCSSDLKLRRQLSELLVMLLHNLVDAAHAWSQAQAAGPGSAAAAEVTSGAESGAGAAAAVAAAPVDSGVAAMTGLQQQGDEGGSSAGCGTNNDVQQPSSALTEQQQQQQPPGSPSLEDALSSPQPGNGQQQQQQKQKQQRQRGGDLPPLPPSAAAAASQGSGGLPAAAGHAAATAAAQNFAAVFGCSSLKLMADTLLQVAVDTSQLYGAASSSSGGSSSSTSSGDDSSDDDAADKDVMVVKDALQLLLRLLEQQPALVQALLLDVDQSPLISVVLVNPHHAALRRQAAELLERLVSSETHPRLLPWLLQQLAAARAVAQSLPGSSEEFYELLAAMVARMGKAWGALPQQLYAVAAQMLDDEVSALRAAAAAPAPAAAAIGTGSGRSSAAAACMLLQGRLQLVLALVRTLDRRGVGSDSQGGLIRLLLQEFLFPEAVQQLAAAAGRLDLQSCAAKIEPRCATPSCRKAALELLSELMGDSPSSFEEGVALLIDLHYQQQTLRGWNMSPRPLRPPGQYMGLKNGGATCYMNAVFQQLFMQPAIRAGVLGAAVVEPGEAPDSVFAQLQSMFAMMALGRSTFFIPRDFWGAFKDYDGSPIDVKEHQDAYEFFTRLQDGVDQHLIAAGQPPAIAAVMGGRFVQQIICTGQPFSSERVEEFYQISVDVKGMGSLGRSLDDYVKGELMEGDNAYFCEELGRRVPAVKRSAIKALPQLLCIHLKRFEFDYHNQTRYKVRDRFEFPLEIDMYKYTADGLAAADAQQKAAEQQQGEQQQQRPLDRQGSEASQQQDGGGGGTTSSGGGGGPLPRQLSDAMSGKPAAAGSSSGGSSSSDEFMYDLMGVVVHSGSAFTGHYYSYIKERRPVAAAGGGSSKGSAAAAAGGGGRWYAFDDKSVMPWDIKELELECFGGKPSQDYDSRCSRPARNEYERAHSAYMLFYERRQQQPETAAAAAAAAGDAAAAEQQQGDGDVAMAPASPSSSKAAAAAGEAAAAADPDAASTDGSIPYNMPLRLYKSVMEHNISLMWQQHVLDKDYFRFVRQLVDSRGDLGQLSSRKSRRRDGSVSTPAAAAGGGGSGSSSRIVSSMSCDVPAAGTAAAAKQQQQQPQIIVDAGDVSTAAAAAAAGATSPCPMAISPAPAAPPAAAPPAAATIHSSSNGLMLSPPTEPQASPGPSSRRGEEADAVAQALLRLGVLFQFQVALRASDVLRSESHVWSEALTSLMGSGPSSSSCMQLFLELAVNHPDWLQLFLVDADNERVPLAPRHWAVVMLTWLLEAAGKRCARQLADYVAQMLRLGSIFGGAGGAGAAASSQQQQQQLPAAAWADAAQALRAQQPPLAQAVMAFVERVAELIRDCVPTKHRASSSTGGSGAAGGGSNGNGLPEAPEIPADAARVLLRYTQLGPWAAAHLMQVLQVVPDVADILAAFVAAAEPDEEMLLEDVAPLYELLAELVRHATNLPQLAAEADGRPLPLPVQPQSSEASVNDSLLPPLRNPYLRSVASSANAADTAAAGSTASAAAAAAVVQLGQPLTLPQQAYKALLQPPLLRGLACVAAAPSPGTLALAGLLSWNCCKVSEVVIRAAGTALCKSLHSHPAAQDQGGSNGGSNARMVEAMRKHLALMVLQPDSFVKDRCAFLLTGSYASAAAAARSGSGSIDGSSSSSSVGAAAPGLAVWVEAVSWPCVGFFKFLGGFFEDLRGWQGPQDAGMISRQLARAVFDTGYIYEAGMKLVDALKGTGEYAEVLGAVQVVLIEAQAAAKERQAIAAAAAAGSSGAAGAGGSVAAVAAAAAAAAGGSGSGGAGGSVSQ